MIKYVLKRILQLIPVLFGAIFVIYLILYLTPGDAVNQILGADYTEEAAIELRHELGLDRPFFVQLFDYVWKLLHGDMGTSYITGLKVIDQIKVRLPNTIYMTIGAMLVCVVIAIPVGIRAATKPESLFSTCSTVFALVGISIPGFWLGLMLILLFSVQLNWLPSSGSDSFKSFILPSIAQGFGYMAGTMRMMRSSMIEAIGEDYVRTAKSKGVSNHNAVHKHALKNALLPTINVIGMNVAGLLGGACLTETVFSIPGLGRLLIESLQKRDHPCVLAVLIIMAIEVGIISLIVDLICAQIDPRIKAKFVKE